MFSRILIANRGEIACRVIRTARRLGIETVAVYSDADAGALHVEMADEAVRIGPAPSAESYLRGDAIIDAAKRSGAEAIHPGYGFLSENPEFVEAVERAGLIFIGPPAAAIRAMGLKDAAKRAMEKAKVPVVPGYHGEAQELVVLSGKANEIGFPVLIKARAGGGGKGMRRVDRQSDFAEALSSAKREARSSFGDDRVLVEKYVAKPRHIEIQVFADGHGNAVHLFERDCSLQRRHQKVVEEAPAPGMTPEMRAAMGKAAVDAAKAIGYVGAGTVEFIVDASEGLQADRFWFMEMNTRLQVEHPVTEKITGLDLVEWQLRVAAGEPLPEDQEGLSIDGWAFEVRIYAEDARRDFIPATGTIAHLVFPEEGVRVDSGVRAGDTITPFYDPMIAKLVTHGQSRDEALAAMRRALAATEIAGTTTNLDFLRALLAHEGFAEGDVDTGVIDRDMASFIPAPEPSPDWVEAVAAVLASRMMLLGEVSHDPFASLGPWAHWGAPFRHVSIGQGGDHFDFKVEKLHEGWRVTGETSPPVTIDLEPTDANSADDIWRVTLEGRSLKVRIVRHKSGITIFHAGRAHEFAIEDENWHGAEDVGAGDAIVAPMPGIVRQVAKSAGDMVTKGETVLVMEAMKMEMALPAPRDGVIDTIRVAEGAQVNDGDTLALLVKGDGE